MRDDERSGFGKTIPRLEVYKPRQIAIRCVIDAMTGSQPHLPVLQTLKLALHGAIDLAIDTASVQFQLGGHLKNIQEI